MAYVTVKRTFLLLLQMIAFYLLRIILGAACALCEFYFYGLALHVCAKRITLQYMCYSPIPRAHRIVPFIEHIS